MDTIQEKDWHGLEVEEVAAALEADPAKGLSDEEALRRTERFGPNELAQKKGQGPIVRFLLQFNQPLVIILLVATVVTLFLREHVDAAVIFSVVLVNALIGFMQETKALKAIEALAKAMTSEAKVLRGGERHRLPSSRLVPGDIVLLQSGDKVPADMRLIKTRELQIDESALTGMSVPVQKQNTVLPVDMVGGTDAIWLIPQP